MATILPEILLNPHRPRSELDVLEAIRENVSDDWIVFQGFEFRTYSRKFRKDGSVSPVRLGGQMEDGEIDFIFFKPGAGFVVLEVKGGEITLARSTWFQNQQPVAPVSQARKGAFFIKDLLKDRLRGQYAFTFSYAVCFPDVCRRFDDSELPADAIGKVITRADLDSIGTRIGVILDRQGRYVGGAESPALTLEAGKRVLLPVFEHRIPLADLFQRENAKLLELTDEQYDLFRAMRRFKRLRVRGCAGSGKTLMAVKKARELADEGKKTAIFCFNTILAGEIRDATADAGGLIVADALLEFCAAQAGFTRPEVTHRRDDPDFWEKELPAVGGRPSSRKGRRPSSTPC